MTWKQQYKNYRVNRKHEKRWHAKAWMRGFKEGWIGVDSIKNVRTKAKWRAVCCDKRNKTDKDKERAFSQLFPYKFTHVYVDEHDLYSIIPENECVEC